MATTFDYFPYQNTFPHLPLLIVYPIYIFTAQTPTSRWLMESAPPQAAENNTAASSSSSSSSSSQAMPSYHGTTNSTQGLMGKHRLAAAISHLNQQIQIIQEELDQLETIGGASTVCQELISSIDSVPDALLPVSRGPVDVGWDRWFHGAQSSRRRWI
ncbi:hypothetical protein ACJIZ3_004295 [Penstemon smallii]|uniref:G protein gamma domain-containing protein n=1 Tax=Penstemon smallii TaxID=265156 RepID=A0ABD3S1Q7_9LAMI